MPFRGCTAMPEMAALFSGFVTQPAKPARVADPAMEAADLRNFLLVDIAI